MPFELFKRIFFKETEDTEQKLKESIRDFNKKDPKRTKNRLKRKKKRNHIKRMK